MQKFPVPAPPFPEGHSLGNIKETKETAKEAPDLR